MSREIRGREEDRRPDDQKPLCRLGIEAQGGLAEIEHELDVLQRDGVVLEPLPAQSSHNITARKESGRRWRHECQ